MNYKKYKLNCSNQSRHNNNKIKNNNNIVKYIIKNCYIITLYAKGIPNNLYPYLCISLIN